MSWFTANTPKRKDNTPQNPRQTIGNSWCRYVHLTQHKLPLYCRLSQQVSCHQGDGRLISRHLNTSMQNHLQNTVYQRKWCLGSGNNFISDKFTTFCRSLNIAQAFSSSYHHQILNIKSNPHTALLQIRWTHLGPGMPSSARLLFNHWIRCIIPAIERPLIGANDNDKHYEASVKKKHKKW